MNSSNRGGIVARHPYFLKTSFWVEYMPMAAIDHSKERVYDWNSFLGSTEKAMGDRVEIVHESGKRIQAIFDGTISPPMESAPEGLRFIHRSVPVNYFEGVNRSGDSILSIRLISQNTDCDGNPTCPEVSIDINLLRRRSSHPLVE
jgi:hypothetical protein